MRGKLRHYKGFRRELFHDVEERCADVSRQEDVLPRVAYDKGQRTMDEGLGIEGIDKHAAGRQDILTA